MRVAKNGAYGDRALEKALRRGAAIVAVRVFDLCQRLRRDAQLTADAFVPLKAVEIQKLRAGGIGIVCFEHFAAGQSEYQPAVDGAYAKLLFFRQGFLPEGCGAGATPPLQRESKVTEEFRSGSSHSRKIPGP